MSAEWIIGILVSVILCLVAIIYVLLRSEDKRLAKNIHSLRNTVQSIVMALAARGIRVPRQKDE
jgi:Flp pilus assembly protein TadB